MNEAGGDPVRRMLAAWERAAADVSGRLVRDPAVLKAGASALRAHLEWRRAWNATVGALLDPFASARGPSRPFAAARGR